MNRYSIFSQCLWQHTNTTQISLSHEVPLIGWDEAGSDMSGHVEGEVNYKKSFLLLFFCLQSETLTDLQWGADPSGGWTEPSVSCGGPRAATLSAMRRLRRETTPGTPVCHQKVRIRDLCVCVVWFCVVLFVASDASAAFAHPDPQRMNQSVCMWPRMQAHVMSPQLSEEGDMDGSPECNSSICCFNNSAADCISAPWTGDTSGGREEAWGTLHRDGIQEVTGDVDDDVLHPYPPRQSPLLLHPLLLLFFLQHGRGH